MTWGRDKVYQLIDVYRAFELLWNPKHPDYFSKVLKQEAWEEVARATDRSVADVKKKVEYLLASLRREKMKMKKRIRKGQKQHNVKQDQQAHSSTSCVYDGSTMGIPFFSCGVEEKQESSLVKKEHPSDDDWDSDSGPPEGYKSSWFAFEKLMFLWENKKARKAPYSYTPPNTRVSQIEMAVENNEDLSISETSSGETSQTNPTPPAIVKRSLPPTPHHPKKKRLATESEKRLAEAPDVHRHIPHADDDSLHFGNMVAAKLRLFDESTRCAVQMDIMNVLFRASEGHYSRRASSLRLAEDARPSPTSSPGYSDSSSQYSRGQQPTHSNQSESTSGSSFPTLLSHPNIPDTYSETKFIG